MEQQIVSVKIEQILSVGKDGFRRLVQPIVRVIADRRLSPNMLTVCSMVLSVAAAFVFGGGRLRSAALLLLLAGFLDVIDGGVARASSRTTHFGALLDSVMDRYSEFAVFLGIGYHFYNRVNFDVDSKRLLLLVIGIAMGASLIVSYVRARAEGLGFECKVGLFQRPERLVVLSIGALISETALIAVIGLIAVMANVSAFQRMLHIWKIERSGQLRAAVSDGG